MTELTPVVVTEGLTYIAALVGFTPDRTLVTAWHMALTRALEAEGIRPVTAEEYRAAMLHLAHTIKFRPTPSEAWDYVRTRRSQAQDERRLQIERG